MFRWLSRLFGVRPRTAEQQLRESIAEQTLKLQSKMLESALSVYDNIVDLREPYIDTPDFIYPGGPSALPPYIDNRGKGEVLPVYITEYGLKLARDRCRWLARFNEFAINAHENRVSYAIGKGMGYKAVRRHRPGQAPPEGRDALADQVQAVLDEFRSRVGWWQREDEAAYRCDRDGEALLRFSHDGGGYADVRFVEPEYLRDPSGDKAETNFGVENTPGDVEDVVRYHIAEHPEVGFNTSPVEAEWIVHLKANVESTAKRGLPTMYPVRKNLDRADKLLRNMSILAQTQSTFAAIRRHKNYSKSAIDGYQQGAADFNFADPVSGNQRYLKRFQPGSVVDSTQDTEWLFPAAAVNGGGLVQILQAELRAVASRLCMPEYMLTGDASNANYASTMVAESPFVRRMERLQAYYAERFGNGVFPSEGHGDTERAVRRSGCMWRVVYAAVLGGRLPPEALTEIEIQVEGPSLVVRDQEKETRRNELLNKAGVMSKGTWSKKEALDREQEKRLLAEEKDDQPPQQSPGGGGDDGGDPFGGMLGESVLEGGFSGRKQDSRGRNICYADGKRVGCGGAGDEHGQRHAEGVRDHLRRIAGGDASSESAKDLAGKLAVMTAKELKGLKAEHGFAATGLRQQLADRILAEAQQKLTERVHWEREARKAGVRPRDLHDAAEEYHSNAKAFVGQMHKLLVDTRKAYASLNPGKALHRGMQAFRDGDHTEIPGFDALARTMAGRYPEILGNHGYDSEVGYDDEASAAEQKLFDLLSAGTPPPPARSDAYASALEYLSSQPKAARRPKPAPDAEEVPF